jgi:CAAX amino terminal protease family.
MNPADSEGRVAHEQMIKWRTFALLLASSIIVSLLVIPYSLSLTSIGGQTRPAPPLLIVMATILSTLFMSSIAIPIGLWLGEQIGLGAPVLEAWVSGDPGASRQFRAEAPIAIGAGLVTGVLVLLLSAAVGPLMPPPKQTFAPPAVWQGLLASISAGVNEEIWMRLGLMTLVAWVLTRIFGGKNVGPVAGWTSIIFATLVFGALHLPQASMLFGLSLPVVVWALAGNGLAGIVFGWLYWRRSLLSAMLAHFSTDIILHVIAPAFSFIR